MCEHICATEDAASRCLAADGGPEGRFGQSLAWFTLAVAAHLLRNRPRLVVHAPARLVDVVRKRRFLDLRLRRHAGHLEVVLVGGGLACLSELAPEILGGAVRPSGRSQLGKRAATADESGESGRGDARRDDDVSFHIRHSSTNERRETRERPALYSSHFLSRPASPLPERRKQARPLDRGKEVREGERL